MNIHFLAYKQITKKKKEKQIRNEKYERIM